MTLTSTLRPAVVNDSMLLYGSPFMQLVKSRQARLLSEQRSGARTSSFLFGMDDVCNCAPGIYNPSICFPTNSSTCVPAHGAQLAMGEYVIKCRFQSNRTQRYIRLHMSLSALRLGLSLNDILAHA